MPLRPRLVLGLLLAASVAGVSLTWGDTGNGLVVSVGSWLAVVSLGTLWTTGLLWLRYPRDDERGPPWLLARWSRVATLAAGGAVCGLLLCVLGTRPGLDPFSASVLGVTSLLVVGGLGSVIVSRGSHREGSRLVAFGAALAAGVALVGLAVGSVGRDGGALGTTVVRALHLLAVGTWLGGAVWHNTVVVPAVTADEQTAIRPLLGTFRGVVPLLIATVLLTGLVQATTWLGTGLSAYLTTTVGHLVLGKLAVVLVLAAIVGHARLRTHRPADGPDST